MSSEDIGRAFMLPWMDSCDGRGWVLSSSSAGCMRDTCQSNRSKVGPGRRPLRSTEKSRVCFRTPDCFSTFVSLIHIPDIPSLRMLRK